VATTNALRELYWRSDDGDAEYCGLREGGRLNNLELATIQAKGSDSEDAKSKSDDFVPQLIAVDDYLVGIVGPRKWLGDLDKRVDIYALEPRTGFAFHSASFSVK
jgi:hypothetical protein